MSRYLRPIRSVSLARKSTSSIIFHWSKKSTYPQPFFLPSRSFTVPPSTKTTNTKDASTPHTIPPAPPKPKVELRPSPVKPTLAPSSSRSPKLKQQPTTNASPPLQSTSFTAKSSGTIAETVKEDLNYAYTHGVLARPPQDAGKLATLWHQVKELFVRSTRSVRSGVAVALTFTLLQKFYLRGLKLIITHRKQAKEIQARVKAGGEPLSRWESRFIRTNKNDIAR
jgi:LETM1 and EF-hand domain-containing protein 1, mitochondrial